MGTPMQDHDRVYGSTRRSNLCVQRKDVCNGRVVLPTNEVMVVSDVIKSTLLGTVTDIVEIASFSVLSPQALTAERPPMPSIIIFL